MLCHPNDHVWGPFNSKTRARKCVRCGTVRGDYTPTYVGSPTLPVPVPYTATRQCEIDKINPTKHCTNTATHWMFIHTIEMFPGPKSARLCQTCLNTEFERPFEERKYYHSGTPRPLD